MKVLHIITGLKSGGAEQQLRLLLRHLDAECEVITLTDDGEVGDALRADGVRVTHLRMHGNRDVRALPRLVSLVHAARPGIVHTHLYRACVYGRVAARLAGVRTVVATEHSLGASQIEGRPLNAGVRALYQATERLGNGTFAVSETVARRLQEWGVDPSRVHVAPNGIEPARFRFDAEGRAATRARLGIPADAFVVGGVGRQVSGKRFDTLIRAVARNPGMHLVLAGDGPERVPLLRLAHSLGVQGRVRIADSYYVSDVSELLSAVDLFASPSAEEAFGLAVVEALAAGLPTLYAACPALEDLRPEDTPGARRIGPDDDLAAALREELQAGQRRLPVPAAVEHYDIERTAEQVMGLYTRIAGRGGLFRSAARPAPVPRPATELAPAPTTTPVPAPAVPTPAATTESVPAADQASSPSTLPAPAPAPEPSPAAKAPAARRALSVFKPGSTRSTATPGTGTKTPESPTPAIHKTPAARRALSVFKPGSTRSTATPGTGTKATESPTPAARRALSALKSASGRTAAPADAASGRAAAQSNARK